jgi:hypothetical protein
MPELPRMRALAADATGMREAQPVSRTAEPLSQVGHGALKLERPLRERKKLRAASARRMEAIPQAERGSRAEHRISKAECPPVEPSA